MDNSLLIYICAASGQAPEWIKVLPLGKVELRAGDSRGPFEVTTEDLSGIIMTFELEGLDLVVDYEHQSLGDGKAPAAGWVKSLEARGDGLYARVEWTAEGRRLIEAKEYRYFSPVISLVEVGPRSGPKVRRPRYLRHIALTNTPAMTRLAPLLAAKYGEGGETEILVLSSPAETPAPQQQEEATAMLKKLIGIFGLKPEATEAEVLALVESREQEAVALKVQVAVLPEIAQAAGLEATATSSQIKGAVLALKSGAEHLTSLRTDLEALKGEQSRSQAQKTVDEARTARKIAPAQEAWALKYATEDLEGFKAFVAAAPEILSGQELKPPRGGGGKDGLDADELEVCRMTGVTPEAFKAEKTKLAAGQ